MDNTGYKVGVFCTTKAITDEAFRRAIELLDEMSEKEAWRDTVRFHMTDRVVTFQNNSTIKFIDRVENIFGLKLDEVLYHSLLTLERYGDTIRLLHLMEIAWGGEKDRSTESYYEAPVSILSQQDQEHFRKQNGS